MNTAIPSSLQRVSDTELLVELQRLAGCEREATVHVIAALMEVEARRLHLHQTSASITHLKLFQRRPRSQPDPPS